MGYSPSTRAATIPAGRIPEFDSATRSSSSRFGRLQVFLVAHSSDVPEKKAHLLTLCRDQIYRTVCAFVHSKMLANVPCDELLAALTAHFDPRRPNSTARCSSVGTSLQVSWLVPAQRHSGNWPRTVTSEHRARPHGSTTIPPCSPSMLCDGTYLCAASATPISSSISSWSSTCL